MSLNSHWINTLIIECLIIFLFFNLLVCIYTCIFDSFVEKKYPIKKRAKKAYRD